MSKLDRQLPELVPIPARFDVSESVSTTDSGMLIRATERSSGRTVGIRRLPLEFTTSPEALARLLDLDHPNLLPVRGIFRDQTGIYLVTDWAERGRLADRLAAGYPDAVVLHTVSRGVSRALSYLHQRNIAPALLDTDQILETSAGLFQLAGYGVPEQSGEETSFNQCQADDGSGTDRFQVDLLAFATLIESLRDELPASLRAICARCRPEATDSLRSAGELLLEIERLPDVLALSEFDHLRECPGAADRPTGDSRSDGSGRGETTAEQFPWRPMEDLYRLEGSAMKGGMGSVWMATELATGRKVAIKRLLKKAGHGSNELSRFSREAQSIAHLSHPHILHLLQPARDTQGDYLVLEWAAGGSLRERLSANGPLAPNEVLEIARKIGGALAYAHTKGVVHRDIKPHNILLDETGEPKLADFGLARSMDDATLSSSLAGAGSPLYMPPEQYDSTRNSDARSDIYSLGKTLYQLLTNKSPVSPLPELLPKRFRAALTHCMEAEPEDRPASVEEFLSELEQGRRRSRLLPILLAASVLLAATWLYSLTGAGAPGQSGDPDAELTKVGGGAQQGGPTPANPGVGPDLVVSAQVLLAGLFTGDGVRELDPGQPTDQDRVEIRLEFDPPPADDRPEIVVRRGADRLAPEELGIRWVEAGVVLVSVPLSGRDNQFELAVPERSFQQTLNVVRMDPQPVLDSVSGAERIEAADELYLTRSETVEIQLDVARARGIHKLWLARGETREEVTIEHSRIEQTVKLSEGENDFRWFWPDESSPLGSGRFRIRADFTPPEIALARPAPDLLTNQGVLTLKGKVSDANLGLEIGWKLSQDGRLVTEGSTATEQNGSFHDEALVPDGADGTLSLEFSAVDRAGNPAPALRIFLRVDRRPPELKAEPSFTPGWDQTHKLVDVVLSGAADEPLLSATVNDQAMEIVSETGFRISGLRVRKGEGYSVVLTDLAGNRSAARRFAHALDVTPPEARLRFVEREGALLLEVSPLEPLTALSVDGEELDGGLLGSASILAPVSGSLSERIGWKPVHGQPVSGPTNAPIELNMTDGSGNLTSFWLVVCPEDGVTAVRCTVDPEGRIAGTEACAQCGGRYCPRTGTRGEHVLAGEWPVDYWLRPSERQCGYCGWHNPLNP